jgi:putative membrane protein
MHYENFHIGLNIILWVLGIMLLFLIFIIPFDTLGQRRKKNSAYNLLQKRFIIGDITESEYKNKKKILEEEI